MDRVFSELGSSMGRTVHVFSGVLMLYYPIPMPNVKAYPVMVPKPKILSHGCKPKHKTLDQTQTQNPNLGLSVQEGQAGTGARAGRAGETVARVGWAGKLVTLKRAPL